MNFKLKDIRIKNFLSFKDVSFTNFKDDKVLGFKDYNVLIGKNNAGKSNLFKLLIELKEVLRGKSLDINMLFDKKRDKYAEITLTFSISEGYRKKLFTRLYDEKQLFNVFEEPEDCPNEWNDNTLQWLIEQGFYDHIDISFSYNNRWETLILNQIFIQHNGYSYGSILFQLDPHEQENLYYYLIKKEKLLNAKNLRSYLKQSFSFKQDYSSSEKIQYQDSHLQAHINRLKNRLSDTNGIYYNLLFAILIEDIFALLFSKDFIHYIPDKRRFERSSDIVDLDKTTLLPDGSNLSKFVANQAINNRIWLDEFNFELKSIFPYIEEFSSKIENNNSLFHSKEKNLENILRLENLGAGILNVALFLLYIKYNIDEGKILLIEEPELFIFPGLQKKIRNYFLKKASKNQIFITTHSPHYISRDFDNSAIYQIEKINNSTVVKRISDENILDVFKELDLNIYDYLLYDGILFVEGQDDLNVFQLISDEVFEPKFKIIQCYGKKNFTYYAEAEILHLLTESGLNYLFLLDLDRGNENIWSKIKDDEFRNILEDNTIKLFSYEIENIFLQPILIIDYLFTKIKIQNLVADSRWLFENFERIFLEKGENNLKYVLKKFIDSNYDWFGKDDYEYIYNGSEEIRTFDNLYHHWIERIEEVLNRKDEFFEVKINEKVKLVEKLKGIKAIYDDHYTKKEYFKIISGKEVIKELKVLLINRFKLSETISVENLSIHLLKFLGDYNYLFAEKGKEPDIFNFKEEFLAYEQETIPITEEQLIDFINYLDKLKKLIIGIQTNLDCQFQKYFEKINRMDFQQMFIFLIKRWNLTL